MDYTAERMQWLDFTPSATKLLDDKVAAGKKERRGRKEKEKEGKNTDLAETSNTSTRSTQHRKTGRPLSGGVWWRGVLQSREMEAAYHLF